MPMGREHKHHNRRTDCLALQTFLFSYMADGNSHVKKASPRLTDGTVSFTTASPVAAGPMIGATGAEGVTSGETSAAHEAQVREEDYYVNVVFSYLSLAKLKDKNGKYKKKKVRYDRSHQIPILVWQENELTKELANKYCYNDSNNRALELFVNCDDFEFLEDGIVGQDNWLLERLGETIDDIVNFVLLVSGNIACSRRFHFLVSGFYPIEELVYSLCRIFNHSLPEESYYDYFVPYAESLFSERISELKAKGASFIVEHVEIWECFYSEIDALSDYDAYIETRFAMRKWQVDDRLSFWGSILGQDPMAPVPQEHYEEKMVPFNGREYSGKEITAKSEEIGSRLTEEELKAANKIVEERIDDYFIGDIPMPVRIVGTVLWGIATTAFSPLSVINLGIDIYKYTVKGEDNQADILIDAIGLIPVVGVVRAVKSVGKVGKEAIEFGKTSRKLAKAGDDVYEAGKSYGEAVSSANTALRQHAEIEEINSVLNLKNNKIGIDRFKELMKQKSALEASESRNIAKASELTKRREAIESTSSIYQSAYKEHQAASTNLKNAAGELFTFGKDKRTDFEILFKELKRKDITLDNLQFVEQAFDLGLGLGSTARSTINVATSGNRNNKG